MSHGYKRSHASPVPSISIQWDGKAMEYKATAIGTGNVAYGPTKGEARRRVLVEVRKAPQPRNYNFPRRSYYDLNLQGTLRCTLK